MIAFRTLRITLFGPFFLFNSPISILLSDPNRPRFFVGLFLSRAIDEDVTLKVNHRSGNRSREINEGPKAPKTVISQDT